MLSSRAPLSLSQSLPLLSLYLYFSVPYTLFCYIHTSLPLCLPTRFALCSLSASALSLRKLGASFFLKKLSHLLSIVAPTKWLSSPPFLNLQWTSWQCECQRGYAHSSYAHKERQLTGWLEINPTAWLWLLEWCSGSGSVPALRTDARTATVPPPQNPISPAKLSKEEEKEKEEKGWDRFDWEKQNRVKENREENGSKVF